VAVVGPLVTPPLVGATPSTDYGFDDTLEIIVAVDLR
jgi:hypothetical protein